MIARDVEVICPDCKEPVRPVTEGLFHGYMVCLCRWNGREPSLEEAVRFWNLTTALRQVPDHMAKVRAMTARQTLIEGGNGIYFFEKQTRKATPANVHARRLVALCIADEVRRLEDLRKRLLGAAGAGAGDDLCRTEQPPNSGKMT